MSQVSLQLVWSRPFIWLSGIYGRALSSLKSGIFNSRSTEQKVDLIVRGALPWFAIIISGYFKWSTSSEVIFKLFVIIVIFMKGGSMITAFWCVGGTLNLRNSISTNQLIEFHAFRITGNCSVFILEIFARITAADNTIKSVWMESTFDTSITSDSIDHGVTWQMTIAIWKKIWWGCITAIAIWRRFWFAVTADLIRMLS